MCRPTVRTLVDRCGADHLLWGTDMPFQSRFCTYRQSRAYLENHCREFLDDTQLALLLGGTAQRVLGIPDRRSNLALNIPRVAWLFNEKQRSDNNSYSFELRIRTSAIIAEYLTNYLTHEQGSVSD